MRFKGSVFFIGLLISQFAVPSLGQEKVRMMVDAKDIPTEFIVIARREVGLMHFDGNRIIANNDWLSNLSLTVKNVSLRPIKRLSVYVTIPKQGNMQVDHGMSFLFPQPDRALDEAGKPVGAYLPPALKKLDPGATVKLWEWPGTMMESLKKQGVTDVESVKLRVEMVIFDDGTGWLRGMAVREDPDGSGKLLPEPSGKP